jgi:hypothetical protein
MNLDCLQADQNLFIRFHTCCPIQSQYSEMITTIQTYHVRPYVSTRIRKIPVSELAGFLVIFSDF